MGPDGNSTPIELSVNYDKMIAQIKHGGKTIEPVNMRRISTPRYFSKRNIYIENVLNHEMLLVLVKVWYFTRVTGYSSLILYSYGQAYLTLARNKTSAEPLPSCSGDATHRRETSNAEESVATQWRWYYKDGTEWRLFEYVSIGLF